MSLNELLIGTTTSKPWCNIIANDVKTSSMTVNSVDANSIIGTDNDKKLSVYSGFDEKKYIKLSTDQTITGKKTFAGGAPIKGVTDGSNASAFYIGEYKEVPVVNYNVPSGGAFGTAAIMTLGQGDYDVSIDATLDISKAYYVSGGISVELDGFPNEIYGVNDCEISTTSNPVGNWSAQPFRVPRFRVNINSGTTLYFVIVWSGDPDGSVVVNGRMFARRMR